MNTGGDYMLKKFRHLIIGFVLGALFFRVIPVGAAIQEYILYKSEVQLTVDGQEYNNPELPILNYKGYNYIPAATFRDICNAIGVDFQWAGQVNQIQLRTGNVPIEPNNVNESEVTNVPETTTIQYDQTTGLPVGAEYIEYGDCEKAVSYNGKIFVSSSDLKWVFRLRWGGMIDTIASYTKDDKKVSIDVTDQSKCFGANSNMYYDIELFNELIGE
jgi:hypothetical protein